MASISVNDLLLNLTLGRQETQQELSKHPININKYLNIIAENNIGGETFISNYGEYMYAMTELMPEFRQYVRADEFYALCVYRHIIDHLVKNTFAELC